MSITKILVWLGKRMALSILFFLSYVIVQMAWHINLKPSPASPAVTMGMLLVVCIFYALIVGELVYRSGMSTGKKIIALSVFLFGVVTLQAMDESLFFRDSVAIPVPQQIQMIGMGLIRAILMALAAVWLIPGRKASPEDRIDWKQRGFGNWALRIMAIALVFPGVYELCGYAIAWQSSAVQAYYQNGTQISMLPLCSFQVLRGLIWCGIALLGLMMTQGKKLEQILCVGLAMGLLHSVQIIIPSAYMPAEVRYVHLVELFVSITAIGLFAAWLLRGKVQYESAADVQPQNI